MPFWIVAVPEFTKKIRFAPPPETVLPPRSTVKPSASSSTGNESVRVMLPVTLIVSTSALPLAVVMALARSASFATVNVAACARGVPMASAATSAVLLSKARRKAGRNATHCTGKALK